MSANQEIFATGRKSICLQFPLESSKSSGVDHRGAARARKGSFTLRCDVSSLHIRLPARPKASSLSKFGCACCDVFDRAMYIYLVYRVGLLWYQCIGSGDTCVKEIFVSVH